MDDNNKKISLLEAVSIWVWWMVWGWIFAVLWEAVLLWHSATPIAFLFAWIIAILTWYSYAKLSVAYPSEWWTIMFLFKAFWKNIFTQSFNLILWMSYMVTISLYALAFGSYLLTFFPWYMWNELVKHIFITLAILLPTILNLFDWKTIAKYEFYIVWLKVLILLFILVVWLNYIEPSHFSNIFNEKPFSIVIAGMVIFVAYEWFELIANSAKEILNPTKNLPIAYYISTISVTLLYVLIAILVVWTLNEATIVKTSDYALAEATKPALWVFWFKLVWIAAILATLSAINATIYWNARLWYSLAVDRELPSYFSKKIGNNTYLGVVLVWIISIFMANLIDLTSISVIASAGFLLIFSFVNLSALKKSSSIKAKKIIVIPSIILTFWALFILLFETYNTNKLAIYLFLWILLFSVLFEWIYWVTKDEQIARLNKVKNHFKNIYSKILKNK